MNVTGIILCGGESRRMGQDKGLMIYAGLPMVSQVVKRFDKTSECLLSCNQNVDDYEKLGFKTFPDVEHSEIPKGAGPLLGILSAMEQATEDWLLFCPCDTPNIPSHYYERMTQTACDQLAFACVAHDGERRQNLHLLLHKKFKESLQMYLLSGRRRTGEWLQSIGVLDVDFSNEKADFLNINSMQDWPDNQSS